MIPNEPQVVELRRYRLRPGRREALIALFEREFVEPQEAAGMAVLGQFRDLDDADRFTWLRGFADMATRRAALEAFYGGPVWQAHREAANATMIDSDDVLLLRPAWPGAGLAATHRDGPASGCVDACVFPLKTPADLVLLAIAQELLCPVLRRAGARRVGWYVSEHAPNDYPRLPVREGEPVLVGLALFDDAAALDAFIHGGTWQREAAPRLDPYLAGPPEARRLVPTDRSAIRR